MINQSGYLLIDGARALSGLSALMETGAKHVCLYKGKAAASLGQVAPYLFEYEPESELAEKYLALGWGNAWGVPLTSGADFMEVYHHFRKFLLVQTEDYKQLYFRFYDPRVLREFLPTCTMSQLKEFFGPVEKFVCESEERGSTGTIEFSIVENTLFKNIIQDN